MKPTATGLIGLLLVLAGAPLGAVFGIIHRPQPLPADAPASEFSASRAAIHVRAMARAPHPLGSHEHDRVRDYVLAELRRLNLAPQVQTDFAVDTAFAGWDPRTTTSGRVENIVAHLPGARQQGRAILLMSHYDSVPSGPGAGDDAQGVATLLETVRALRAGPPLLNDVMVVITDGEEAGLLGAEAFAANHPWRRDAGIILNLDARGNSGPAVLTRIAEPDGWMARTYAGSVPYPLASSVTNEVYRLVPAGTDVQAFYPYSVPSMDFAIFKRVLHYHSSLDTPENLDLSSVQQQGSNMLALAKRLGASDLTKVTGKDATFFSVPPHGMVVYPSSLAVPLGLGVAALASILLIAALRQRRIALRGLLLGLIPILLAIAAAPLLTAWLWPAFSTWYSNRNGVAWHDLYSGDAQLLAAIFCLTLAVLLAILHLSRKWLDDRHLCASALLVGIPLVLAASILVPPASYIVTWPWLGAALAFGAAIVRPGRFTVAVLAIAALPALVLVPPIIYLMFLVLNVRELWILAALAILMLLQVLPQILYCMPRWRMWTAAALAAISVAIPMASLASHVPTPSRPWFDSMSYVGDADARTAVWASFDRRPDPWTRQYIGTPTRRVAFLGMDGRYSALEAPAKYLDQPAPELRVVAVHQEGAVRRIQIRIWSPRGAPNLLLRLSPTSPTTLRSIGGVPLDRKLKADHVITCWNVPADGVEIELETGAARLEGLLFDASYGLPEVVGAQFQPRSASMARSPIRDNDSTFLKRRFSF